MKSNATRIVEFPQAQPKQNGNGHAKQNGHGHAALESAAPAVLPGPALHYGLIPQEIFVRNLALERRRTERSRKPFVLMLLDVTGLGKNGTKGHALRRLIPALQQTTRETDTLGWYEDDRILGVLFTEFGDASVQVVPETLVKRLLENLSQRLTAEEISKIEITCHLYPEDNSRRRPGPPMDSRLYADLSEQKSSGKPSAIAKRSMDVILSSLAILVLSPVLLAIAIAIKLSSPGPVFFRQRRIGQGGVPFTFLKFRSMQAANDAKIHRDYVVNFIRGQAKANGEKKVFKLTDDPRVTAVGRFIRRTSLDELPQFFNVLRGEMSLVGPRPPIEYELEAYDIWHRRRLLEAKPGITGPWQVSARSKTSFDDMVRLDLQYAMRRSFWLDLKILLQTPAAVLSGEGAH